MNTHEVLIVVDTVINYMEYVSLEAQLKYFAQRTSEKPPLLWTKSSLQFFEKANRYITRKKNLLFAKLAAQRTLDRPPLFTP